MNGASVGIGFALVALAGCQVVPRAENIRRVGVERVRAKLRSGAPTLLVSAYADRESPRAVLEGSISLEALEARAGTLPKDAEIVFYCG